MRSEEEHMPSPAGGETTPDGRPPQPFGPEVMDEFLLDLAAQTVIAMSRSMDTRKVSPENWWQRLQTALEAAASESVDWPGFAARFAAKAQVDSFDAKAAKEIVEIGKTACAYPGALPRFLSLAESRSIYIVADARNRRDQQKAEWAARKMKEKA